MTTVVVDYRCPACQGVSSGSVEVTEPEISEDDLASLRRSRDLVDIYKARLGVVREREEDPGDEMRRSLRSTFAHDALLYATCPSCNARNPEGVTKHRAERRNWRWGLAAFFGLLAATAYFHPRVALFVPAISALLLGAHLFVRARAKLPIAWLAIVFQALMVSAFVVAIVDFPRYAFAVPLLAALQMLWTRSSDDPFEQAKEKIVFRKSAYRS